MPLRLLRGDIAAAQHMVLASPDAPDFAPVLGAAATLAVCLCAVWFWCVATATALEALRGVRQVEGTGLRGGVRRLLLAGCGVALAATATPAQADGLGTVAGQPPQPLTAAVHADRGSHTVQEGDSLWSISADRLGPQATDADVDRAWHRLWRANATIVGDHPDLIEPGQLLRLPESFR